MTSPALTVPLEYHGFVRRLIPASLALFGKSLSTSVTLSLLALLLVFPTGSQAQVVKPPTSVTSQGFGGAHPITAPFPAAGALPGHSGSYSSTGRSASSGGEHHHHRYVPYTPPVIYAVPVPVPYAVDIGAAEYESDPANDEADDDASDANYQGGPTIFDRRGYGAESYIPPQRDIDSTRFNDADASPAAPAPEPTTLVFKDGHTIEVGNYAIVGATLFDLTPGHARKVALADLDLPSTQHQNDTHGITFQLPPPTQAN